MKFLHRRWILSIGLAVVLAGAGFVSVSGKSSGSSENKLARNFSQAPTISVVTTPNPCEQYLTSVHPNSDLAFANASDGWKVDGQGSNPYQYGNLTAGPNDTEFQWPGDSVSATSDGGATWTTILSAPGGVWGVDLLNQSVGFVIGVTTVYRSTDGGNTWSVVPEPLGNSIAMADFSSTSTGIAVTTNGAVITTSDGGATWTQSSSNSSFAVTSLCMSSSTTGFATNANGDVYATSNSGSTWQNVYSPSPVHGTLFGIWSSLSCNTNGEAVAGDDYLVQGIASSGTPYEVAAGGTTASSWAEISPTSTLSPAASPSPTASWPSDLQQVAIDDSGEIVAVGATGSSSGVTVAEIGSGEGSTLTSSIISSGFLAASSAGTSTVIVNGVALAGVSVFVSTTSLEGSSNLGLSFLAGNLNSASWRTQSQSVISAPTTVPLSAQAPPVANQAVN